MSQSLLATCGLDAHGTRGRGGAELMLVRSAGPGAQEVLFYLYAKGVADTVNN